jgi:type I restriction enzyme, S subunit
MKQGWEIKKLGEVCEVIAGQSPEGKFYNSKGNGMPFYQGKKEFGEKYIGEPTTWTTNITKEAEANDILMSVRAPVGPVNFATQKICIGRGLAAIRSGKNIDKDFLYNFLIKYEKEIEGNVGAVFNSINKSQIESIDIPLPPLPEQQRIVSILDEAFAAIAKAKANAEKNLKNARELFDSYLQGVFEKKGDGWEEKTIGEIGNPKMCKRIFKEQTTTVGDIPFYKIGTFGKEPDAYISKEIYDEFRAKYSFPKKGDVLISASGTIGRRVRYDGEPAYFQDSNIVWIENDEKQVSNDFLFEFYRACNWGSTKGATISRLYNDNLKSIKISFPKSHKEQQTIVRQLDALRAETQQLEAVYQKKIANLEELKKSILQKAFAGELQLSESGFAGL